MKKLSTLALVLAFALCLFVPAFASGEPSAEAPAAGGQSVEDAYVDYIHEFLLAELEINSSMTIEQIEDEFMPLVEAGDYVSFPADMLYSGMLNSGAAMTFEEFAAQYVPAGGGSGTVQPGEYTDGANTLVINDDLTFTCTTGGEDMDGNAFTLYVIGTVTEDGAVTVTSLTDGAVELLEVASEDQVANDTATVESLVALAMAGGEASGEASGDTSEDAYKAYLKEYVQAVPAVSDEQYLEFEAGIDAGDYASFPVEMCFTDTYWGFTAMTYDEFVAAGGVYEIPAFDANLTAD